MLRDQRFHARPFFVSIPDVDSNQNHSVCGLFQTINELAEILVLRQQDATFRKGGLQDFIIRDARLSFRYVGDVVAGDPETGHDACVAALIGKKFHEFTRYRKAICSSAR